MWLNEFQADGLRWDATSYIRNAHGHDGDAGADIAEGWGLMQRINQDIEQKLPGKLKIAEDLQGNAWLTKAINNGGAGFDSQWDNNFFHPIRQAIITPRDEDRDMVAVAQALPPVTTAPLGSALFTQNPTMKSPTAKHGYQKKLHQAMSTVIQPKSAPF